MPRLAVLAAVLVLLSGCVWSRLLDWKGQLKEFDRYIEAVDDGPALALRFKKPCIRPADIGYLLGGDKPSRTVARDGGGVLVAWILRRDRPESQGLEIVLGAPDDDKETLADSLVVPPPVLQFIPKERLLAMARAFGSAQIDQDKRQASAGVSGPEAKPLLPGRTTVISALGEPDASETVDGLDRLTFRYRLVAPDGKLGEKPSELIIDLRGELLVAARLKAPNFNAWMKFAD